MRERATGRERPIEGRAASSRLARSNLVLLALQDLPSERTSRPHVMVRAASRSITIHPSSQSRVRTHLSNLASLGAAP